MRGREGLGKIVSCNAGHRGDRYRLQRRRAVEFAAVRSVHFVGSVVLDGPEDVFEAIGRQCGPMLKPVPDGEPGGRRLWMSRQIPVLRSNPSLEAVGPGRISRGRDPRLALDFIKTSAEAARS